MGGVLADTGVPRMHMAKFLPVDLHVLATTGSLTAFWRRIMLEQEFLGPIDMNQLLFTYRTCIEKIEGRGGKVMTSPQ